MRDFKGEKLKKIRVSRGMSQKALAEYLGISDRAISKWETGLSQPSAKNLIMAARVLNVSVEELLETETCEQPKNNATVSGMESITELYKIGRGPSSSHTIGPERACIAFKQKYAQAERFKVILYGSLAKTGIGHGTDAVIKKTLSPKTCEVELDLFKTDIPHPNTMDLLAYRSGEEIGRARVMSVGGGSIAFEDDIIKPKDRPFALDKFSDIAK